MINTRRLDSRSLLAKLKDNAIDNGKVFEERGEEEGKDWKSKQE